MSAFLVRRDMVWLFVHQAATGVSALLLLAAALQMSRGFVLRPIHAVAVPISIAWAWITVYGMGSMMVGRHLGDAAALGVGHDLDRRRLLARARRACSSGAAPVLAGAFILWGLHHLDYPLLRGFGAAVLYGVFADVLFLFAIGLGLLFVVLGDERDRLAARTAELEQLTAADAARAGGRAAAHRAELHDEAGQVLTAVKIELELDGRHEAGAMVGRRAGAGARPQQPAAAVGARRPRPGGRRCGRWPTTSRRGRASHVALDVEGASRRLAAGRRSGDLPRRAGSADQRRPPRAAPADARVRVVERRARRCA